jgi:iron complex outermembrane receptor protein
MPAEGVNESAIKEPHFSGEKLLRMRNFFEIILMVFFIALTETSTGQDNKYEIRGSVSDTAGNVLIGASITVESTFIGTHSGIDGRYLIKGLKAGSFNIHFSYIGYEEKVQKVALRENTELNVKLTQKPFIAGEVIVSATRAGEHSPMAFTTVDESFLRKQNSGQDLPYMLGMTPSLVETSEAGNGIGYTNLRIRGTDASRINVTIDGIPLNDAESQQVFWVDLPDLASSVENIQVQRGIGTSSNGAGAFGATISIQSRNPGNEPFAQTDISAGSFSTLKKMVAAGTGLLADKFALQMRFSQLTSDGYIERTGSDHRSAFISGVFRSTNSHLKLNIILGEEHTGIGWWGVPKEMLAVNRRYNPAGEYTDETGALKYYDNETDNYWQNHYQLIYSLSINKNLNLNAGLHYTSGKGYYEEYREDQLLWDYRLPDVSIGDTMITESDLIRRKWMSNDFYGIVYSLKYSKDRFEAVMGGGVNNYDGDHFGKIIWMEHPGSVEKDHRWYINDGSKIEVSLYGKADYSISDKISLFGDLQYRYIDYLMVGFDDDFKDLLQTHDYGFFNPKAGIFFSPAPNQDAFLSFSVANREPTRADFKEASGDPEATPLPETLYDTEAGYKLRGGKYSLSANLYAMIYKDQMVPTGELSNVGYPITTNVTKSHRMGIEISAGVKPLKSVAWDFSVTLSRNKITDFTEYYTDYNTSDWSSEYKSKSLGSVYIAYSPSIIGSSDLLFGPLKNMELHIISKYVGKQYFDNTMSPERMLDPYFVNNLRIDFEPKISVIKNAEFQLLINNIFNNHYESNAYGGNWYEDGVEKTWSYYFPQAGTNLMFRIGLTF